MIKKTDFDQIFSHQMAEVNGVNLHFVKGGTGEPIVLLHGFPQTWYEWHRIMPALAERYTVIAPDLRGIGASSKPVSGYDSKTVAEDIYQLVNQLGLQKISIVGHDIGAPVAVAYAENYPEEVRRLVVIEGAKMPEASQIPPQYWHMGFHAEPDIAESLIAGRERLYLSWFYRKFGYNPAAFTEADIDEYVRWYSEVGAMRAALQHYRNRQPDSAEKNEGETRKLEMPILAIGGEYSMGSGVEMMMQGFASNVRGSVLKNCGHWIAEEQPEELTNQLLNFFGE